MTPTDFIAEARRVAEAATPGPWLVIGSDVTTPAVDIVRWAYADLPPGEWADAEERAAAQLDLIAFMRNHWDEMVDVVEAALGLSLCPFCTAWDWAGRVFSHKDACPLARLEAITKENA